MRRTRSRIVTRNSQSRGHRRHHSAVEHGRPAHELHPRPCTTDSRAQLRIVARSSPTFIYFFLLNTTLLEADLAYWRPTLRFSHASPRIGSVVVYGVISHL